MAGPIGTTKGWRPHGASPRRAAIAIAINVGCGLAAISLFAVIRPPSDWGSSAILVTLAAIAAVAFAAELRFKSSLAAYFDATLVLAVIALAIAGPLPALCIWVIPDLLSRYVVRQDPMLSPGLVATVSGYALALLAGYGVLSLADSTSLHTQAPALYTAGLVMWAIDFAVARLVFAPFYQGLRPRPLVHNEFFGLAPAVMGMLAVGVVVTALVPALDVAALAPLALVVLVPQLAFAALARSRSIARLDQPVATGIYARALSDELRLSRFERRLVDATVARMARVEGRGWISVQGEPPLTGAAALGVDERWDGGGPLGVHAGNMLRVSRVVSVARAWSSLTAADSPRLTHTEAMLDLSARAGSEFDPEVVESAAEIVAAEGALTRSADFEPRLHRLPLPASLRSRGLPAIAERLGAPV
jgi:hypothetical protein